MAYASTADLYLSHHGWLVSWLRGRVRCQDKACDLVQDLFCKLLERPPVTAIEKPRAFLATSAIRLLIDQKRRLAIEQAYVQALAILRDDDTAATPLQVCEAVEALTAIARMLETLAEKPRRAFLMNRLDGLGHAEIGERLGVSSSTVKQYVAAALVHCHGVLHPPE
ncbi:RNA polymerase subunit sigma [Pseudoroseomonas rhizosphaerae]|uniref:RNA polymerase subunit sigma n=1 Tax=Teichococcus rhizosphaerae TaxID=1335062 RepID=A0A2C7ADS0_9PROT|nr:sigma-70 family RNA polymerase sigma factor [Pseudoroseomonas rhizosphaerae]PHK95266.1 RNA polymerase subunit sigma [Pseudoroseomonas rhizosphaerae]